MDKSSYPSWKKKALGFSIEIIFLVTLHQVLIHVMADKNVAATVFTGGASVPLTTRFLAIMFILVRLLTVLCLPGIILTRLGLIWCERRKDVRGGGGGECHPELAEGPD